MKKEVAKNFTRGLFWDVRQGDLDFDEDKHYIVHRVLSYGDMDDMRSLVKAYGRDQVRKEFLKPDPGTYQPEILKLCQFILGVKKLNPRMYVKDLRGPMVRPY